MNPTVRMPSLYLPHGGGPAFFMAGGMHQMFQPMQAFLAGLQASLPGPPRAILVVSAHWEAEVASFCGSARPALVYDYYGFPPETYALTYPAPAAPELAVQAAAALAAAGIPSRVDPDHGWDHGVFIPLKVMFAQADIPVLAMSLQASLDPLAHVAMGEALQDLRAQGVLVVGSGMSYHNLRLLNSPSARPQSLAFDAWLDTALAGDLAHRRAHLAQWAQAPAGRDAHPREEHLLPLMVASGAGSDLPAHKIWTGLVGHSQVSAWRFD